MLVCKKCKGSNVHILAWVDANTNEYRNEYSGGDTEDNWCENCQEHVDLIGKQYDDEESE